MINSNAFDAYMGDYYKCKMGVREICDKAGLSPSAFRRYLERKGLLACGNYRNEINTGIGALDKTLRSKYSSIVGRCNGKSIDHYGHYAGLDYMPIQEWVEFCDEHKALLASMWQEYLARGKDSRYAISVDRIDNTKGYLRGNIQFVTHGYNSWKRGIRPIKVEHDGATMQFLSCEDAACHYKLRRQTIGECLRHAPHCMAGYDVTESTVEEVLSSRGLPNLEAYYRALLDNEQKRWDTRKRWHGNSRKATELCVTG